MTDQFQVGIVAAPHGIKGDVKVFPTTDEPKRFSKLKKVYLTRKGQTKLHTVSNVRYSGKFVVLHLSGIETPEEARLLHNVPLMIDRADAMPLPEGMYYIPDLIGCTVVDEDGHMVGTLTDVLRTGANDVYEVTREDGSTLLVPVSRDCILDTDVEEGRIRVHLLPGL